MSVNPAIFVIFQHKVERIPHFARVTEVRHMRIKINIKTGHYLRNESITMCLADAVIA